MRRAPLQDGLVRAERRRAGREDSSSVRRLRHERPRDERRGALGRAHRGRRAREGAGRDGRGRVVGRRRGHPRERDVARVLGHGAYAHRVEDVPILREVLEGAEDDGRELRVVEAAAGLLCWEHASVVLVCSMA